MDLEDKEQALIEEEEQDIEQMKVKEKAHKIKVNEIQTLHDDMMKEISEIS